MAIPTGMIFTSSIAVVSALAVAHIPEPCRVYEVEAFTGSADLPDGQIFGRVARTRVTQRAYSPLARFETGVVWIRREEAKGREKVAMKISYDFWWDDASGKSEIGPRRGDLFLLRVQEGVVVANPVTCPKSGR
jgi:hypothetical protein